MKRRDVHAGLRVEITGHPFKGRTGVVRAKGRLGWFMPVWEIWCDYPTRSAGNSSASTPETYDRSRRSLVEKGVAVLATPFWRQGKTLYPERAGRVLDQR